MMGETQMESWYPLITGSRFERSPEVKVILTTGNDFNAPITKTPLVGMIDTGATRDGLDLVLPEEWRPLLPHDPYEGETLYYTLADGTERWTRLVRVQARFLGDDGAGWPQDGFRSRSAIFVPRHKSVLICKGIWGQWRLLIDGPAEKFSLEVPTWLE